MKYMILLYGSQVAYDAMAGRAVEKPGLTPEDFAPMHAFMEAWNATWSSPGSSSTLVGWPRRSTPGGSSSRMEFPS